MRRFVILSFVALAGFGAGMSAQAAMTIDRPALTGMEVHLKTDTKNLPVSDITDPL